MDKRTQKRKIWLYKDKTTGESKGEATVTYDDADAAQSAITWFDGKDFRGSTVKVQLATKKDNWSGGRGGGGRGGDRGFGGGRGGGGFGGGRGRDGGGTEFILGVIMIFGVIFLKFETHFPIRSSENSYR